MSRVIIDNHLVDLPEPQFELEDEYFDFQELLDEEMRKEKRDRN